jgi:hypothetical protein
MSNHYHLVVRLNSRHAEEWTEEDVIERWEGLFSPPALVTDYRADSLSTQAERKQAQAVIATWRARLCDLSWFMRSLNEDLARRANVEDGCKGRFWEGRFKSQALLDESAVLTCMSYVDLNPVRAGVAETPEASDFTSIQQRIAAYAKSSDETASVMPRLTPLASPNQEAHQQAFLFSTEDYLTLVDWSDRAIREDKRGTISSALPPILERLRIDPDTTSATSGRVDEVIT